MMAAGIRYVGEIMFEKILVPLDGSELASAVLPYVREIALCTDAEVVLLRVVPEPMPGMDGMSAAMLDRQEAFRDSDTPPSVAERAEQDEFLAASRFMTPDLVEREAEADKFLEAIASDFAETGIPTRTCVVIATPDEAILDVANEEGAGLIAMSTHGRSGIGRFLLGSVADRVVHHTHIPLLLVRSTGQDNQNGAAFATYRRILVPLDGSELASAVLPFALEMARCTGAAVTLLQSVHEPELETAEAHTMLALGGAATTTPGESTRLSDNLAMQIERETEPAQSNLNAAADAFRAAGIQVETVVEVGRPAETILDAAASSGADMIAMATHGRSGIRRFLIGSIADRVVQHADVPVLLVRSGHP